MAELGYATALEAVALTGLEVRLLSLVPMDTMTNNTSSPKWTPIYEECVYIPISRLEHAIHEIEQTLDGQYPEGQALKSVLESLQQHMRR